MKKNTGNKIGLGIFVSIGIALFIAGIYFIGDRQQLFSKTFTIRAVFKDVSGLQVGNNVRFAGIVVGTVDNIEILSDTIVRVEMIVEEGPRKFIRRNSKAVIGTDGLMGNKIVTITNGTQESKMVENNDYILTTIPVSLDDILKDIKRTSENASKITSDLAVIINNIRSGRGTVGKLFMDTTFAYNVDQTLVNLKEGAGGFQQNMEAAKDNILFRGFFKRKKKEKEKEKEEKEKREKEEMQAKEKVTKK
ncbi:MAG: MlaD family protein [Bacteroidota bacterium]